MLHTKQQVEVRLAEQQVTKSMRSDDFVAIKHAYKIGVDGLLSLACYVGLSH